MPLEHISIGRHTIDNLTTGMYNDPFCVFREYIQNAADAIDTDAYQRKRDVQKDYEIRINLDPDPQSSLVSIEDNGCGVPVATAAKTLLSLGNSPKISDRERGFRGIGRLGGIAYCDTLIFTTKAKNEPDETIVTWNCSEVRNLLYRHNVNARHLEAKELIAKCVTVKTRASAKQVVSESFFRVEMLGVKSVKGELLDYPKVESYLKEVAPIPFNPSLLHFGKELDGWLRKEVPNYQTYQIFLNDSLLKKKYARTLPIHNGKTDELTHYEQIDIQDRQGKIIARGWLGVRKENIGAVLRTSGFDSLRVRVGNILIGDEKLLDRCFGQDRFNGYLVGEIHITAPELVPNGRRDDFQDTEMKADLLQGVERIIRPLEAKIIKVSKDKNATKPLKEVRQTIISVNKQLEKGFVGDAAKKEAIIEIRTADQKLTDFQRKRSVSDVDKEKAEAESEKLKKLLTEVKEVEPNIDGGLEGTTFSKKEKDAIRKALEAVHELYDKTNSRDELINRVMQKLKRTNR